MECVEQFRCKHRIISLCLNDTKLFCGTSDGIILLYDLSVSNGHEPTELPKQHTGNVESLCLSADKQYLFSAGADTLIRVFQIDPSAGYTYLTTLECHAQPVKSVRANDKVVLSGSSDRSVRVWKIGDWSSHVLESHDKIVQIVCLPDQGDNFGYSAGNDGAIKVWDLTSGECIFNLRDDPTSWIRSMTLAPSNQLLISGDNDKRIQVWDLKNLKLVKTIEDEDKIMQVVAASNCFVVASDNIKVTSFFFF